MRFLNDKKEIAHAINVERMTTIRLDLADSDDYGLVSKNILIDNGYFNDGSPYLIRADLRAYRDDNKFTFSANGVYISNSFGYEHLEEMLSYANAPIVKPDSDVVIALVDSKRKAMFKPIVLHTTKKVSPHTSSPLGFDEDDAQYHTYVEMMNRVSEM